MGVFQELKKMGVKKLDLRIISGGSCLPVSLIEAYEREFHVTMIHAWGMTETSPLGTVGRLRSYMNHWDQAKQMQTR